MSGPRNDVLSISCVVVAALAGLLPSSVGAFQSAPVGSQPVNRGVVVLKAEPESSSSNRPPPCPLPVSNSDLRVDILKANSKKFDRDLAGKLNKAKQDVTLELLKPFPAEQEAPPILSRWLDAVQSTGGRVSTSQYCAKTRGLFSFLRKLIGRKAVDRLDVAKSYDAIIYVNGSDQSVTQIQFLRRSAQ